MKGYKSKNTADKDDAQMNELSLVNRYKGRLRYYIRSKRLWSFLIVWSYLFIFPLFFGVSEVNGISMYPTFKDSDMLLTRDGSSNVDTGDIVIVKKDDLTNAIVKRVIAKGGDRVLLNGSDVYVNGVKQTEGYINTEEVIEYDNMEFEVPYGEYFLLGDNRNHSVDSRKLGSVSSQEIVGVVVFDLSSFGITKSFVRVFNILMILMLVVLFYGNPFSVKK